jgi:hypothetical protein
VDDEVSVAQLLEREGWNDDEPRGPGSRIRVLAVMGAVVLGCGVAAILVRPAPDDEVQALWPEETNVVELPGAPTGGGLPGAVSITATVAGSSSAGPTSSTESEVGPTDDGDPSESSAASSTENPADPAASSATPTDSPTDPRDDLPDSSEQSPPQPSPSTTVPSTTRPPPDDDDDDDAHCPWWYIFC